MTTANLAPSLNPIRADAKEEIPVLDLAPYLRGEPGALEKLGDELRYALENVGFYFIVNHGVPQSLVDATFEAARRFHAIPMEEKMRLKLDANIRGYLPMKQEIVAHTALNKSRRPNLVEAFFVGRDLPADHPDVLAGVPYRGMNQWPESLPGFREDVVRYTDAAQALGKSLLPLYEHALELEPGTLVRRFEEPMFTFRMSHYPQADALADDEFSLAPHSDISFMTLLPQNELPGLVIRLPNGRWIEAPRLDGSYLVNGGDLLRRMTNDRFLATPHQVINRSGRERYAIPFFMDSTYGDVMACLPTCCSESNPARYEPITYRQYRDFYKQANYGATEMKVD